MRRRRLAAAIIFCFCLPLACGGGGSTGGVTETTYAGSFVATTPNPGPETVSLTGSAGSGSSAGVVTIHVNVTDTADIFGATFDVIYDPGMAEFVGWTAGSLLDNDGAVVSYLIESGEPGRIVVSAARPAGETGVDAIGTQQLVHLLVQVNEAGSSTVRFENAALTDPQDPPQPIPGIVFSGGTLLGN